MENAPFLQDGVAEGDVVRYRTDSDGLYWAVELVSSSGSCTNSTSVPRHTAQPQSPAARQRRVAQWSPNSAPIAHWLRVGWIVLRRVGVRRPRLHNLRVVGTASAPRVDEELRMFCRVGYDGCGGHFGPPFRRDGGDGRQHRGDGDRGEQGQACRA
ncbi:DUF4265 domain-containing protein [Streptomyces cadmiisoli]|uniref:DUF4265 domain-containing protein n=1 Tax=Streptomyces cadmiisoli TaxID=2184053 RepID=UPI003CCC4FBE